MSTSTGETNGIAESNIFVDVAFLIELKPSAKKMNPLRIKELKVPFGPLLSQLKAGQTITLPDGRVIQPDDVLEGNTSLEEKPTLLVAECSSLKKLPSLTSSSILQPFTNGSKKLYYLIHMTPHSVFETDEYNRWMKSFGEQCTHLVLNGAGPILPHMDGIYQHRYFQRALCPEIFPELYPTDCKEPISQTTEMPKLDENVFMGLPLSRLIMRCKKNDREKYDSDIKIDLNSSKAKIDDELSEASVKGKIDEFRKS
uniref:ribonuclease Z n=1 Tax=Acrobeloides nanus TaxID=290746 RepID=A0A914D9N3_9BILA